ncbi:hypothetical protein EP01_03290 [Bdellovibrio bacteriovorus]|nr:hypothetical protein EP01_03290 [Bdellovibrio bacteriovorus]
MHTKDPQERQQNPADVIVHPSTAITALGAPTHAWNKKDINQPANTGQTESEKPDGSGDGLAEIKTVRAHKTKDPKNITYKSGVI